MDGIKSQGGRLFFKETKCKFRFRMALSGKENAGDKVAPSVVTCITVCMPAHMHPTGPLPMTACNTVPFLLLACARCTCLHSVSKNEVI